MSSAFTFAAIKPPKLRPEDRQRLDGDPPSWAAYAPDPDADYRAGYRAGYRTGVVHGLADPAGAAVLIRWMPPRRRRSVGHHLTGRGFLIGFAVLVAFALLLEAFG